MEVSLSMDEKARCMLLRMPPEVIRRIASFLPTPGLGAVRLTCKTLENSLFESFSSEFFGWKQFMLTEQSLQALIDISDHPTLSLRLRHVIIATDRLTGARGYNLTAEEFLQYRLAFTDQFCLLAPQRDIQMLAQAFTNLPNLEAISIRDFNSPTRFRDGPAAEWSSYGATTVIRTTRSRMEMGSRLQDDFVSRAFSTVLSALAASPQCRPRELEVLTTGNWGLRDYNLCIPRWLEPSLLPVLSSLEKIHLAMDFAVAYRGWPVFSLPSQFGGGQTRENRSLFTKLFLSKTTNIKCLGLDFQEADVAGYEDLLEWLATPLRTGDPPATDRRPLGEPDPITLPALQQLDIGYANISLPILKNLVEKFSPTVEFLKLRHIQLIDGFSIDHAKVNLWSSFFKGLASTSDLSTSRLRTVTLAHLYQGSLTYTGYKVCLGDSDVKEERSYSGLAMGQFLRTLAAEVSVDWPPPTTDVIESDTSYNDDSDGSLEE